MFERFTDSARAAVVAAQTEARRLRAAEIDVPHVLVGVLVVADEPLRLLLADVGLTIDGIRSELAARSRGEELGTDDAAALEAIGIDLDQVRARLEETYGEGVLDRPAARDRRGRFGDLFGDHIPFTRDAKKVLELSLREAIARHDRVIRAEHILLGVLRSDEPRSTALIEAHLTREELRRVLATHLDAAA
ncbi:Clp protease N-terminal domain-containing protein [Rhodococcus chondri]|uniref:Clp protease N-terminal domain-containing protein n=1 Tax=Rhodococcus chondri TaxID=3065941 RepID=A0ABU7JXR3_9NOCA|nr:Clp protease N-terminal domain-containing protein [Rhodococcus sp. CC-R104]MEE2034805.1 Clp protease N-terminal domain-containing protein [Rhodococcus sp. CC-R104]